MKIWAHRGCSQCYPENTITSFEKAMDIPGLTGIELDVQLTRDGEPVIIHDERVDRTTDGMGYVRDHTLKELKCLHIHTGEEKAEHIPTMKEVLDLLRDRLKKENGLLLNIELKNNSYRYPGMEDKTVELVHEYGIQDSVLYSSFLADSLVKLHEADPSVKLGVLDSRLSDCLYKAMGIEALLADGLKSPVALHPNGRCIDIPKKRFEGRIVRAFFDGHLYPTKPSGGRMDLSALEDIGVTDVFLNEPDKYVRSE